MKSYSNSKINTYESCALKYKYKYIDKIETDIPSTIEAFMGSKVHDSLEKLYKDLQFEKLLSEEELVKFYNSLWEETWDDNILIVKDYEPKHYKMKGERMLKDYYKKHSPFNQTKTIGLETQYMYELSDKYQIHVRIDRLACKGTTYEIHDYKTSNTLMTQDKADQDKQLAIYAMGVKEMYPDAKKIELVWHFLEFDKEIRSSRTEEELESLQEEIIEQIDLIEKAETFEPRMSALCDYCEYKQICPLWKHQYPETEKEEITYEKIKKLVNLYAKAKDKEKELSKKIEIIAAQIKEYAKQNGLKAVYGDDCAVTVWSKDAMKFPGKNDEGYDELIKVLRALNLYERFLELSKWDLEKNFDSLSEIEKEVLSKLGRKEKVERLYIRKNR